MANTMIDNVQTYVQGLFAKNFESKSKKENGFFDNRETYSRENDSGQR
jgi:hypothetical protein